MTDSEATTRRSRRDRKPAKTFLAGGSNKRKRDDTDTEGTRYDPSDFEDVEASGDDQDEEEYSAPKLKTGTSPVKSKAKGRPPGKSSNSPKKPRTPKESATKTGEPAKSSRSAPRKSRKATNKGAPDATKIAEETKISGDNPLFNAIINPTAVLQETVEDFLESLAQSPGPALAEFVNLILRACGCNDSVNADEALDYDGVVDALDTFTEGLKQDDSPVYPLTSKLPAFKKFRKSLADFIHRLITSSAAMGTLYSSELMETLQTWVIAMSSSQIRSFRHTATVIALEVETGLCEVAAAAEKEAAVVGRQKEGERKRKAANKGRGIKEKELDIKAAEVRGRRTKLAEFIKEFVDGVFVHRYRDLDSNIRADCVRAIGLWFKKYPAHFLDGSYLRYVGWVLSDSATTVRLEAVKALSGVYAQADYIGSLNHFTERFKPRLIEMAAGDTELGVRVAVIQVLKAIEGHSLLDDEEREKLCLLMFDEEGKVRIAVSGFVRGVWEEAVEEKLTGRNASEKDRTMAGVKVLATLLVKWGRMLNNVAHDDTEEEDADSAEEVVGGNLPSRVSLMESAALAGTRSKWGRTALAVEALWDEFEPLRDWEGLLDVLLLDHSASREGPVGEEARPRAKGRRTTEDSVDDALRLEEEEETVLLEVLVAAMRHAMGAVGGKKSDESIVNNVTRALIQGLPRLFIKHQTDQKRIASILVIPTLMKLDLYLEMRTLPAYASLWDDVTKQFLTHSSPTVLTHAVAAIRHFMEASGLANTNSTKILELEDELSTSLRDIIAGREEIEVASFTEDEVRLLGTFCARLRILSGTRDMTAWIEENEGGKQSSAWDIISALVDRGRLGYKEEEMLVEEAIHLLSLHIIWKARLLTVVAEPIPDAARYGETLREQRELFLERLTEYAVGTQSNTVDGVKRAAFHSLMNLYILFCPSQKVGSDGSMLPIAQLSLALDDEAQYRCAGFVQAEIERYAEDIADGVIEDESSESSSDDGRKNPRERMKNGKGKRAEKNGLAVNTTSRSKLEQEYVFLEIISTFLRALRSGAIHPSHGAVLLAHYGRLGATFDLCCKVIVDILREEGMFCNNGDLVVTVVVQALQESFTLVLDRIVHDASHTVALAKLLVSCLVLRGAQLAIVRRLDSQLVIRIHTLLLTWIGKRLSVYEKNKNVKSRKLAVMFFRALVPLVTVEGGDAMKIKEHMDEVLTQANVEVSSSSKLWEPQRAYEKRLGTAMSKDKATKGKERKFQRKGGKTTAGETSEEDEGAHSENPLEEPTAPPPARPRPRPVPRVVPQDNVPLTNMEEVEQEAGIQTHTGPDPSTPTARPKPKATYRVRSPTKSPQKMGASPDANVNGQDTAATPRKRARSPDDGGARDQGTDEDLEYIDEVPAVASSREPTPTGDIQIRRKRIRH